MANLASNLWRRAEVDGDRTAIVFGAERCTFAALKVRVARCAAGLERAGFRAGDRIAILLGTRPEFIVAEYAAFALGGVVVALNIFYQSAELEAALSGCDVDFLVTEAAFLERLPAALLARLPALRRAFLVGADPPAGAWSGCASFDSLGDVQGGMVDVVERGADDVALLLQTSATSGRAKSVMLTVGNLQFNYDCTPGWLGLTRDDRILCALPLYNTFALNQCINATMVTGATLVMLPRFDVQECLNAIERHRCTFFPAVPTMLLKVLYDPSVGERDLRSLRRFLIGAAPVPAPLLEQVFRVTGPDSVVMTGYGLTEASALVSLEHCSLDGNGNLHRPRSVGRVLPGMEMKIVDESGHEPAAGTVGEICIRGPNIMQGYYRLEAETARTVVDGWLLTGDLGRVDPDGYFYIVDRKKDLIIRGGQNVYPADIEAVLYEHPAVAEAAVVGVPDEVMGEVPHGFVSLKPGQRLTPEELLLLCKAKLAYFKVPKVIHVLAELPKGPTGKILRRNLRQPT